MPGHYKGTPAESRALDAYIKLVRASETVLSQVREQAAAFHLTEAQFAVLEALHHLGPLKPGVLARKLLRSAGNITTVLDNLARSGWIERRECPNDKRATYIHITKEGEQLIGKVFPAIAGRITGLLSVLKPGEQAALARLTRKLGRGVERAAGE